MIADRILRTTYWIGLLANYQTSFGWSLRKVHKITSIDLGCISAKWGADPVGPISIKIGKVVGVHDVIIHSNFDFNNFSGFSHLQGSKCPFSTVFAGHRYNSAAVTA